MGADIELESRLAKYLDLTSKALAKIQAVPPTRSFLKGGADDMLQMARSYFDDALHFQKEGDLPRALAAVSYAHGWLDAGVRLGLLYGGEDDQAFTQYR
ncbi:MAG: DUF357 domain-containing protein [Candidatus Thermoplasmatota archaeon]|jgi:hypothetical protein|nr:DUF357 domain-containing protein [Candidatus Thermoplasmatota archaeon]